MEIHVGTSGWAYFWNPTRSLEWYINNTPFDTVELNSSFYHIPRPSSVEKWKEYNVLWSVKINKRISHLHRLNENALKIWTQFTERFSPMDEKIAFYLLQMPPSFKLTEENQNRIFNFLDISDREKIAIEFRHESWFDDKVLQRFREKHVTIVSVDSPRIRRVLSTSDTVYIRFHGRTAWYRHDYSQDELYAIAKKVVSLNPRRIFAFFNNDTGMLPNGIKFLEILKKLQK